MPAEKHPEYQEELERCNYTLGYVEKSLTSAVVKKEKIDKDLERTKKHFNSESSQDYIDMMINSTLQDSLSLKLRNLAAARSKPYFARVDFKEKGADSKEKLYIGKMSLSREEDQQIIIVDWRAPIANLYYEGRLGESSYDCPDGNIPGDLLLKRQFSIDEGRLREIFDIDITTNDEFLQTYLGANADNRLKDIVSTIQEEQNRIVRADMWKPLIVQGAAGSGKTTIALHRIAYLIYTYEKSFTPENFMIIAPNRLFLNYISEVLPELGVERVRQTTFEEFAMDLIGKKFKLRDANEKLNMFVNHNVSSDEKDRNGLIWKSSELKTSMLFKEILDEYITLVERSFIPREDFKIGTKVIYTYEEINDLFINQYQRWPLAQRINEIKKHLSTRLKVKKDQIINQLHDECDRKILRLKQTMEDTQERQELIVQAIDKKNQVLGKLDSYSKQAVKEYVAKISRLNPLEYYKDLMSDKSTFDSAVKGRVEEKLAGFTREYTEQILKSGILEIEDIAPVIYLKYCIHGIDEKIPVRHIVIDEAQDFSAFQLYVLKKIVKDSSFTILGDLCQGIHSYRGIRDWDEVIAKAFDDRKTGFLTLEQSYRTTVEIMEAANRVIGHLKGLDLLKAKPVIRHGGEVLMIKKAGMKDICEDMGNKINDLIRQGMKTVAVICKTMDECKEVYASLHKKVDGIRIITGKEEEYKGGLVIVPSYLSKGLEFDVVMLANAGREQYTGDELDIKLLYVAMTRPLHRLYIYYHGELSSLLD